MPDSEKIKAMSWLAIYEKNHDADVFRVNEHSRADYVISHVFLSFVSFTLCFGMLFAIYVIFNSNEFFYNINMAGLGSMIRKVIILYGVMTGIYLLIVTVVYIVRYEKAKKAADTYSVRLKKFYRKYLRRRTD